MSDPSPQVWGHVALVVRGPGAGVSSPQFWPVLQALGPDSGGREDGSEHLRCPQCSRPGNAGARALF